MSNNRSTVRRPRNRHSTDAHYGLYPDGCVAIKLRDERGDWWSAAISWGTFERMHEAMAEERETNHRRIGLDGVHHHEGDPAW